MKWNKKKCISAAIVAMGLTLAACSGGKGTDGSSAEDVPSQAASPVQDTEMARTGDAAQETEAPAGQTASASEGKKSSDAGWTEVLALRLPEDESRFSDPVYGSEDEDTLTVQFYDVEAESGALARASRHEDGGPAEYYVFDEGTKKTYEAKAPDGSKLEVAVMMTIENSDIPGILASWEHDGIYYTLWEDESRDRPDAVARTAAAIAEAGI